MAAKRRNGSVASARSHAPFTVLHCARRLRGCVRPIIEAIEALRAAVLGFPAGLWHYGAVGGDPRGFSSRAGRDRDEGV